MANITVADVPSEAGTHWHGLGKAPEAIRAAGIVEKLAAAGYKVNSASTLEKPYFWRSSISGGVNNEAGQLEVSRSIRKTLTEVMSYHLASDPAHLLFAIGGDCAVSPAVFCALSDSNPNSDEKLGIMYFDGDVDLTLPNEGGCTAILDSMVLTHYTQREGGLESMKEFSKGDGSPLVDPSNIVLFAFQPGEPKLQHTMWLLENGYKAFTAPTVRSAPAAKAKEALSWLEDRVDGFLLHFDVDSIDSQEYPLANFPHYDGLKFEQAMDCLDIFIGSSKKMRGILVTEVNPNNDPDGNMVEVLVERIVKAFAARLQYLEL